MRTRIISSTAFTMLAIAAWSPAAWTESDDARCHVTKHGDATQGASGDCTFSLRSGQVEIDLRNGTTYSLKPGEKPDHFKDQRGYKVVRTKINDNREEYLWEGDKKIVVVLNEASSGGYGKKITVANMSRHCASEAAARYNQSPRNVTTQKPAEDGGAYAVWGQYTGRPSPQVFVCSFSRQGHYIGVHKYRP